MISANSLIPPTATHPGEILADELVARKMTQQQLADQMQTSQSIISQIIHRKRGISILLALKLENALGISAEFWVNAQARHDRIVSYHRQAREIKKLKVSEEKAKALLAPFLAPFQ